MINGDSDVVKSLFNGSSEFIFHNFIIYFSNTGF